jgi:hypothetical protein
VLQNCSAAAMKQTAVSRETTRTSFCRSSDGCLMMSMVLDFARRALVSPTAQARLAASAPWLPAPVVATIGSQGLIGIAISLLF